MTPIDQAVQRYDAAQRGDTGAWSTTREREEAALVLADLIVAEARRQTKRAEAR